MTDELLDGSLGGSFGNPDASLFSPDGGLLDAQGANAVLDRLEPLQPSPERTAFCSALEAVVRGRASPEDLALVSRVERLKDGLGRLRDHSSNL